MHNFIHFLYALESVALHVLWLPVVVWTLLALAVSSLLHFYNRSIAAVYHYYSRIGLLWGLAAGIAGSALLYYFPFHASGDQGISTRFIVIQNPILVSGQTNLASIPWGDPSFWIGVITLSVLVAAVIALLKLTANFIALNSFAQKLGRSDNLLSQKVSVANSRLLSEQNRPIHIYCSEEVEVPCTFGWSQKYILIPPALQTDSTKLNMALRHELIHIKNRDYLLSTTVNIIKALFFFHPVVHKLSSSIDAYREIYCDQHVLRDANISQKRYARLLFELSPHAVFKTSAAVNMAVYPSTLKKRIETMKNSTQPLLSFRLSLTLMVLSSLMITGLMACSDLEDNGITQSEVQQTQANMAQTPSNNEPLYVVNGEKMTSQRLQLSRLDPKYIKSIDVLKGKHATDQYGEAGKNGVIQIKLSVDNETAFNNLLDKAPSQPTKPKRPENEIYVTAKKAPQMIGGRKALLNKLTYPETCRQAGIEGQVTVQFIVTKQGDVQNPKVLKGIGGGCDKAAIEAIRQVKFKPAQQNGKAVNVRYTWPIQFKLPNKNNTVK